MDTLSQSRRWPSSVPTDSRRKHSGFSQTASVSRTIVRGNRPDSTARARLARSLRASRPTLTENVCVGVSNAVFCGRSRISRKPLFVVEARQVRDTASFVYPDDRTKVTMSCLSRLGSKCSHCLCRVERRRAGEPTTAARPAAAPARHVLRNWLYVCHELFGRRVSPGAHAVISCAACIVPHADHDAGQPAN